MSNSINRYLINDKSSKPLILLFDILIVLFASYITFLMIYGHIGLSSDSLRLNAFYLTVVLVVFKISFLSILQKNGNVISKFTLFSDFGRLLFTLFLAYAVSFVVLSVAGIEIQTIELLRIISLVFVFDVFLMLISRVIIKELYKSLTEENVDSSTRVFVYGSKHSVAKIANALIRNKQLNFKVMGLISNEPKMVDEELMGLKVFGVNEKLFEALKENKVGKIIICSGLLEEKDIHSDLEMFVDNKISLISIKTPFNIWDGDITCMCQLRELEIEDLLPRNTITINWKEISEKFEGKRIMITGAAGSIGREIARQVILLNPQSVILIDSSESPLYEIMAEIKKKCLNVKVKFFVANVNNKPRMKHIFSLTHPHYIFHAAAYKQIPMMEGNISESIQNNVLGTKIIADLSIEYQVDKFIMISTDKAANPTSIMDLSKRICEIYLQSLAKDNKFNEKSSTKFLIPRFRNVLGTNGSVIPLFREQIKNGGPVTVSHPDIVRYFMTIPETCHMILGTAAYGTGEKIYFFNMGRPMKILNIAERMIQLSGFNNIHIDITGLRKGENLSDELITIDEITTREKQEQIMIAHFQNCNSKQIKDEIDDLITISYLYDDLKTVRKMKEIVSNSKFNESTYKLVDYAVDYSSK